MILYRFIIMKKYNTSEFRNEKPDADGSSCFIKLNPDCSILFFTKNRTQESINGNEEWKAKVFQFFGPSYLYCLIKSKVVCSDQEQSCMLCASICIFFVLTQGSIDVMGNKNTANVKVSSAITPTKTNSPIINDLSEPEKERKYRLLCLHGIEPYIHDLHIVKP